MKRLGALLTFFLLFALQGAITFPELTGRVVDEAGLLSNTQQEALTAELANLENTTTDQLVIVTLESLQGYDIADYGYQLGRHWGIGQKEKNNGVLLIVAPNERKVRIEVGYGLEGTLTDYKSKMIIDNAIIPFFKKGDYSAGIEAGANAIIALLKDPTQVPAKPASDQKSDRSHMWNFDWAIFLFFAVSFLSGIVSTQGKPVRSALVSLVSGGIVFALFASFIIALFVFFITFIIAYFGSGQSGYGGYGSSDGGFSSGGGFSGGGGSFGGGGASGSW